MDDRDFWDVRQEVLRVPQGLREEVLRLPPGLREKVLRLHPGLQKELLYLPEGLREQVMRQPYVLLETLLCLPEGLREEVLRLPEGLREEVLRLPEGLQKKLMSLPEGLRKKLICLPEVFISGLRKKLICLPEGLPEQVMRVPYVFLETLLCLPEGLREEVLRLHEGLREKLICLPEAVREEVLLLPAAVREEVLLLPAGLREQVMRQPYESLEGLLSPGEARETNLQENNMKLQDELKREKLRSAQLEQKIKEQAIKQKQFRGLPRYEMSSRPRGICVIINNINFGDECKREGAELDESELARLYTELQFEVHPFRDLQWDEMRRVAVDFAKKDHSQFDAFVFIVMSHGGDKDVIYGVSGRHTRVEDLMSEFKAANCQTLRNKPKLFIIQTCRGSSNESLSPASCDSDTAAGFSPDSTLARSVCPQEADFLLSFATAPGYKAWRYPGFGSPYIQFLVEEIRKHHHSYHLLDILTEVNRRVVEEGIRDGKAIQCPAPTHTLQRQVFL